MLFHLHHIHHQCSPALTKLSDFSSDLYHLHEKKRERNITKASFLTGRSLKKKSLLAQMPYTLMCDAHTTKSYLRMIRGENIATLQKNQHRHWNGVTMMHNLAYPTCCLSHCTIASCTLSSDTNTYLSRSVFNIPNIWKLHGNKTRLYAGCLNTSHDTKFSQSWMLWSACRHAASCLRMMPSLNLPWWLFYILVHDFWHLWQLYFTHW